MKPLLLIAGAAAAALMATGCSSTTVTPPDAGAPAPAATAGQPADTQAPAATQPPAAATQEGTRENPHPLGSKITSDEWSVVVNSFTADATAEVKKANQFNDDPDEGTAYALVNVTVTREADEAASPLFGVSVDYVTAGGNVVTTSDALVVGPDELSHNELFKGASATGNIVLQVPTGDAGVLRVKPGLFAAGVFVAIS